MLFDAQIKTLPLAITVYSNQAEEIGFHFGTVDVSHVDGEQVAFWNNRLSLGRQMTEHFMKYINWDINGKA
jgi:hypothetical protein